MKKLWPILICFGIATVVSSQSLLDKKINIICDNLLLQEALFQLIDQSDVSLSFSNKIIPADQRVSISVANQPLRDVLDVLLAETGLNYNEVGSQIVLTFDPALLPEYTLSGYVRDGETGENIIGAIIYEPDLNIGTYTNEFGFFSLTFKKGDAHIFVSNLGYDPVQLDIDHREDKHLDLELTTAWLTPVIVSFFNDSSTIVQTPNSFDLNMNQANRTASLGGESDLVRTAFTFPGIQTGADGFGGLSVRGGDIDQNLFLLDGVPIYNAMHGIGLFSIYNNSAIRSAKILKGSFPARYGGRMSSVWDIQTKEGNKKELLGELDLGITSAKLTLEGPLKKNKGSFFFSGRRSLFDFYSEPISRKLRENGGFVSYHFDDLNLKFNYDLSKKDRLYLSYYSGNDNYDDLRVLTRSFTDTVSAVNDSEQVDWGNKIAALRWNHVFTGRLFGNTTLTYSSYKYTSKDLVDLVVSNSTDTINRDIILQLYASEIEDFSVKTDFDYAKFRSHKIKFGGQYTRHRFRTKIASFEEATRIDYIDRDTVGDYSNQPLFANELDFYLEDELKINDRLYANIGLRISSSLVLDNWIVLPQPRLLLKYSPNRRISYDLSFSRMTQFLHLLSPSRLGLPKDLWVTSTKMVPPQESWQLAFGMNRKLRKGFSIDFDLYYKKLYNQLFFKGPIEAINAINWQEQVSIGKGRSYGAEVLFQRRGKKWSGWLSYTLSWSNRQFPKDINLGESFPIKLDRRHNLNIQTLYRLNKKWDLAAGYMLASGSYYSLPTQEYTIQQFSGLPTSIDPIPIPEGVNDRQLVPYHRLDFSVSYHIRGETSKHIVKAGVSNLYNRLNPLFRTIRDKYESDGVLSTEFVEVSLLPLFPSLRYILELR